MNIRDTQANAPTSIQMETFFKKESTVIHIHTLVLECGPRKRNTQNENGHKRHTCECNHMKTDGIILQKKGTAIRTHTYIHKHTH